MANTTKTKQTKKTAKEECMGKLADKNIRIWDECYDSREHPVEGLKKQFKNISVFICISPFVPYTLCSKGNEK